MNFTHPGEDDDTLQDRSGDPASSPDASPDSEQVAWIVGGPLVHIFGGTLGDDVTNGRAGGDIIYGGQGATICVAVLATTISWAVTALAKDRAVFGGAGNDVRRAGDGENEVNGDSRDDLLFGNIVRN